MGAGFAVPPLSRQKIYDRATQIRERFEPFFGNGPRVPIDRIYETLHLFLPDFTFEVCDCAELGDDHGLTFPERRLIKLREDIYVGMCEGVGRDRFTAAHELGHLFLHSTPGFPRKLDPSAPRYLDSEWQANSFASAFLIDERHLAGCRSVADVAQTFGVSEDAARVRFKK